MNSTFSVNRATLRVLKEELERGDDFARGIEQDIDTWEALVHPTDFFTKYKDLIRVDVIAATVCHRGNTAPVSRYSALTRRPTLHTPPCARRLHRSPCMHGSIPRSYQNLHVSSPNPPASSSSGVNFR